MIPRVSDIANVMAKRCVDYIDRMEEKTWRWAFF